MDLQSWFYLLAVISMALWVIFLIVAISVFIGVYVMIKNVPQKLEETVSRIISKNKGSLMGIAGMAIISLIVARMKSMFRR